MMGNAKRGAYGPLCPLSPVLPAEARARIEAAMEQGWYNRRVRAYMPFDELKAGAMARMAQVDAMPPSQRQAVYVSGLKAATLANKRGVIAQIVKQKLAKQVRGPGDLGL